MTNISPTVKITFGLVLIMISIFLVGNLLGLLPDRDDAIKKGRTDLAESLAVQYSLAAQNRNVNSIKSSMRILVDRNDEVLSAALMEKNGRTLAIAGDHSKHWTTTGKHSTPTNIRVPINQGLKEWGIVEISFKPLHEKGVLGLHISPFVRMSFFITIACFIAFLFFIRKTHQQIDPTEVVPSRVTNALNALAEGVLLLDSKGTIMLANTAFSESMNIKPEKLFGKNASDLDWDFINNFEDDYPWTIAIRTGEIQTGKQLNFTDKSGAKRTLMVNSAPVNDADGNNRGVLTTFDDVTLVEEKNDQLEKMLGLLKNSRDEVKRQNDELKILATRDPMTNCLNRRSFFEKYNPVFETAKKAGHELTCIMSDIDLFKSINDNFGHGRGDEVIIAVAGSLQNSMRSTDAICRYGGEEFCIVLAGMSADDAVKASERARESIENISIPDEPGINISSSFGVASLNPRTDSLAELIDQADQALYLSKDNGRNRVTLWDNQSDVDETGKDHPDPSEKSTASGKQTAGAALPAGDIQDIPSATPDTLLSNEYDSLTGLPNRTIFHSHIMKAIDHCLNNGMYMTVMILDLNMFKRINNALGYKVGDQLLRCVSTRLQDTLRKTDSVTRLDDEEAVTSIYRLGGDEFGILLPAMECAEFTEQIVSRIIDAVTEPLEIDEHELHPSCNVGISIYPENGRDTDTLLNNAGMALYYAKSKGYNRYLLYGDELNNISLENLKLENDLRHAIERDELELHYQPKVELHSGKIIGMEALIRWNHHVLGNIPPAEFIPLAEESGLIVQIGRWVLDTACKKISEWALAGYKDISIAVNLSAVQFRQKDMLEMIRHIIADTGIDPHLLELEITESTIMHDIETASATMRELHREGMRLSIDDFGTGYSSLSHLKCFPLSAVKIDRSFVRDLTTDPDDAAIIGAIIAMAHSMGLKIVAEGVETRRQLEYLSRLRCDEIQGFLFSRPLPGPEAEELLKKDKTGDAFSDTLISIAS